MSRTDYPEAVRSCEIKREAEETGYEINPTIRTNLHVRQRLGQHFQQSGKPAAWTVDPQLVGYAVLFGSVLFNHLVVINRMERVLSTSRCFSMSSLTGSSRGVTTTPHRAHFTHANIFSRVAQGAERAPARIFCLQKSHLHPHKSCFVRSH